LTLILVPSEVCRVLLKEGQSAMDGGLSFVEHDCMDAGGRVTQERLPRDANQNDPATKLVTEILQRNKG